jgi:hypothetical protein
MTFYTLNCKVLISISSPQKIVTVLYFRKQENKPHNNFVSTTTLLEPNNVIPSWEFGGEEKKEVSVTMRKLRQQFDQVRREVNQQEQELERLKRKLE